MKHGVTIGKGPDGKWIPLVMPDLPVSGHKELQRKLRQTDGKIGDLVIVEAQTFFRPDRTFRCGAMSRINQEPSFPDEAAEKARKIADATAKVARDAAAKAKAAKTEADRLEKINADAAAKEAKIAKAKAHKEAEEKAQAEKDAAAKAKAAKTEADKGQGSPAAAGNTEPETGLQDNTPAMES